MKKAKVILSLTLLLAVAGAALAFKAMRTNVRAFTLTTQWTNEAGQTYYTTSSFCSSLPYYQTPQGDNPILIATTLVNAPTKTIIVTRGLSTVTLTVPVTCATTITNTTEAP